MKRAYLVLGPESSGTRLATRLLMSAGCTGDDGHTQQFDVMLPRMTSLIVWRRSVPHDNKWPHIVGMVAALRANDYQVQAVVTTRDWQATILSQITNRLVKDQVEAAANLQRAYRHIFGELEACETPFVVLSYDSLVQRPQQVMRYLARHLALERTPAVEVYDGNAKYLEEQ